MRTSSPSSRLHPSPLLQPSIIGQDDPPKLAIPTTPTSAAKDNSFSYKNIASTTSNATSEYKQKEDDFPSLIPSLNNELPTVNGKENPFAELLIDGDGLSLSPNRVPRSTSILSSSSDTKMSEGNINPGILAAFEQADADADAALTVASTPLRVTLSPTGIQLGIHIDRIDFGDEEDVQKELVLSPLTRQCLTSNSTILEDLDSSGDQEIFTVEDYKENDSEDEEDEEDEEDAEDEQEKEQDWDVEKEEEEEEENASIKLDASTALGNYVHEIQEEQQHQQHVQDDQDVQPSPKNNTNVDADDKEEEEQEKKEKKETQGSEITTMQNKSCNNDDITVPVIIHGIQDELSISRLLNVHSSFKQSELEESITEEKRITNAMLKSSPAPSIMINGRWELTPSRKATKEMNKEEQNNKRKPRRRKRSSNAKDKDGKSTKRRSKSTGANRAGNNQLVHLPLHILTNQLKLRKAAEEQKEQKEQEQRGKQGEQSGDENNTNGAFASLSQSSHTSQSSQPSSPRSRNFRKKSPKNLQPWNPILTKVERERREMRNFRKLVKKQGLKVNRNEKDLRRYNNGYRSGEESGDESSPTHRSSSHSRSKSTPTLTGRHRSQKYWGSDENKEKKENEKQLKRSSSTRFVAITAGVIVIVSMLVAVLLNGSFETLVGTSTHIQDEDNVIHVHISHSNENEQNEKNAKNEKNVKKTRRNPKMSPIEYPTLRLTYPGLGETVFVSESIHIAWDSTAPLDFDTLYMNIDGNAYKVDREGYDVKGMNLLGLSEGVHTIGLEGKTMKKGSKDGSKDGSENGIMGDEVGSSIKLESWFRVLPRPSSLPMNENVVGELNVLKLIGSKTLKNLVQDRNVPDIRKRMIRGLLQEREEGNEKDPENEIDVSPPLSTPLTTTTPSTTATTTVPETKEAEATIIQDASITKLCLDKCEGSRLGKYAKLACKNGCMQ